MIKTIITSLKRFISRVKQHIKQRTRPATTSSVIEAFSDATRSRRDLIIENAMLRQQLIVLNRQVKRPQLTQRDRLGLVLLARLTGFWQPALHIVQPDTLLRWQSFPRTIGDRDLFRGYWRRKSKPKHRKPRILPKTIKLIKQVAKDNLLWGAERIRGELLKLGVKISKRTIQKYMPETREITGQTWTTFLKNHSRHIWACDFTVVHDLLFRPLYVFVIINLQTRQIVQAAVTRTPTDLWTAQQLREAAPWEDGPKYLIRDRDKKFGAHFAAASGIKILKTPVRAPRANSFCERFMGSLKRACLDHMFILNCHQLLRIVQEYIEYYNNSRPHQGLHQLIPNDFVENQNTPWPIGRPAGRITSTPVLGGLHHSYARNALNSH